MRIDRAAIPAVSVLRIRLPRVIGWISFFTAASKHRKGMEAEQYIREARRIIAGTLKAAEKEILFTSGGSESNNMALIGTALANQRAGRHIISTAVEHPSVYNPLTYLEELGFEITFLPVDHNGHISLQQLEEAIRPDTILVSVMYVNNEVGAVEPIEEISLLFRSNYIFSISLDCVHMENH